MKSEVIVPNAEPTSKSLRSIGHFLYRNVLSVYRCNALEQSWIVLVVSDEPVVGATIDIDPMTVLFGSVFDTVFGLAGFEINHSEGTLAQGFFSNIHIDSDAIALMADVTFFNVTDPLPSPFIEDWQTNPDSVMLLGPSGILSLLTAIAGLTQSGILLTDLMVLSRLPLLDADFDSDGDVDGRDYLIWQKGFGTLASATLADSDADGDGDVDDSDLSIWQSNFGAVIAGAPTSAVPELSTAILVALGTVTMSFGRFLANARPKTTGF